MINPVICYFCIIQTNFCTIKHEVKKKENSSRKCTTPLNPYPLNIITKVCKFVLDFAKVFAKIAQRVRGLAAFADNSCIASAEPCLPTAGTDLGNNYFWEYPLRADVTAHKSLNEGEFKLGRVH